MGSSALDGTALLVAIIVSVLITAVMLLSHGGHDHRRGWIAAGVLVGVLGLLAALDLMRESPRETHVSGIVAGIALTVLGSLGFVRGTHRVRPWIRWTLTFVLTFVLFLGGILLGATYVSRLLPF